MTRIEGVGAQRAGQRIEAGGAQCRSGVPSTGLEVGARLLRASGLVVEVKELRLLSCWVDRTTLRLATLVLGELNLLVNCRFTSNPYFILNSTLGIKPRNA